jgi:hypothetical protein
MLQHPTSRYARGRAGAQEEKGHDVPAAAILNPLPVYVVWRSQDTVLAYARVRAFAA